MSRLNPSLVASGCIILAVLAAIPTLGSAREARPPAQVVEESTPLSPQRPEDIIFVMPPLKPWNAAGVQAKKPEKSAETAPPPARPKESPALAGQTSMPAEKAQSLSETSPEGSSALALQGAPPVLASNTSLSVDELTATPRGFDWGDSGLQSGPAPTLAPVLASAGDTDAAAPVEAARPQTDTHTPLAALLAEGVAGPAEVRLADRATMWLPAGRVFVAAAAARKLSGDIGVAWRDGLLGFVGPAGGAVEWLAPVELLDDGHVAVETATPLDADKLLDAAKKNAAGPAHGEKEPLAAVPEGWLSPPAFDANRRLSSCLWVATAGPDAPGPLFNCESWTFGRESAIRVFIAEGGEQAEGLKGEAKALAGTIVFDHGAAYDDFDPATDRAAPYAASEAIIREVSAQPVVKSRPTTPEGAVTSVFSFWGLGSIALFGAALALLVIQLKRRRKWDELWIPPEAAGAQRGAEKLSLLFARLLPSLHARFARKAATAVAPEGSGPAQEQASGASAGLGAARLLSRASQRKAGAAEKTALAMGGSETVAVDPARALRQPRRGAGAGSALIEDRPTSAPTGVLADIAAQASVQRDASGEADKASAAKQPAQDFDRDELGLIEPSAVAAGSR